MELTNDNIASCKPFPKTNLLEITRQYVPKGSLDRKRDKNKKIISFEGSGVFPGGAYIQPYTPLYGFTYGMGFKPLSPSLSPGPLTPIPPLWMWSCARHCKAMQAKARQGKARQGKAMQGKAR